MKPIDWQMQDLRASKTSSSLLHHIRSILNPHSSSPYLDALVLLSTITSCTKSELLSSPNPDLSPDQEAALQQALNQLKSGIPLAYTLGEWEFYKHKFKVTPDVLIPRPESEWLVEKGIAWLVNHPEKRNCLDLGTGSGCLGVSLAKAMPDLFVTATDLSLPALLVADENARKHSVKGQMQFIVSDLFKGIRLQTDLLVANLPYIPSKKLINLAVSRTEPRIALDGGPDGLSYIRKTLKEAPDVLLPGGLALLELDETCGEAALSIAQSTFYQGDIDLIKDLSGLNRYLQIQTR